MSQKAQKRPTTQLAEFNVRGYAKTRNHLDGNVSRLNPYVTWGALTLRDLHNHVLATHPTRDKDHEKFVDELGWKAFFREGFRSLGGRVYTDLEPYKYPTEPKKPGLPQGIENANTGIRAIDDITQELLDTGYLHNHQRLWFASWWVHFAGHDWKSGEAFLYRHLLDGEPGPNALSWQWVASTFSGKPYVFNADNMRRNGVTEIGDAPFDASYEAIDAQFFGGYAQGGYAKRPKEQPHTKPTPHDPSLVRPVGSRPLVVLHPERLSAGAEAVRACPDAPVVIYLDGRRWQAEQPSERRRAFAESLAQAARDTLEEQGRQATVMTIEGPSDLAAKARELGRDTIAAPDSWHPGTWKTLKNLSEDVPVSVVEDAPFAHADASLRSFTAFWKHARKTVARRGPQQPLFEN